MIPRPAPQMLLKIDEIDGDENVRSARKALVGRVNVLLDRCACHLSPPFPVGRVKALLDQCAYQYSTMPPPLCGQTNMRIVCAHVCLAGRSRV